ncbi:MAG: HAMP domain-containing sensor histidine kinase [Bacteroidales bacterium]
MARLKTKLALFNLLSKLVFTAMFFAALPWAIGRINLRQVDNDLIQKREQVMTLLERIGIEPFISSDSVNAFGSFNILKEEFISLEKITTPGDQNFIEVTNRLIDDEEISYRVLNYTFLADGQKYLLEIGKSMKSIREAKRNINSVILPFLVFIILITFITDLQYTRVLLKPLNRITGKLKGISNPSVFDKTSVKTSTSDFIRLDNALKELMEQLDEAFQKEKEITVNISHELLTPVSVLRSKLENLLLRNDLEPEVSIKIEESLMTLHRLQSLVSSLLLIARIESRQYLREDSFDISPLLKEIAEELDPIAADKEIGIKTDLMADLHFSEANRSLIFSMFYNVVNNAVKHTAGKGEVKIKTQMVHRRFEVVVSDNGKGMTIEQIDNLFSRFKSRINRNEDGTGIGLAITKTIADFHSIAISVTSHLNKGTIFSFLFPE